MAVMLHTDAELARVWAVLDEVYGELPHNPRVAGARAARVVACGRRARLVRR